MLHKLKVNLLDLQLTNLLRLLNKSYWMILLDVNRINIFYKYLNNRGGANIKRLCLLFLNISPWKNPYKTITSGFSSTENALFVKRLSNFSKCPPSCLMFPEFKTKLKWLWHHKVACINYHQQFSDSRHENCPSDGLLQKQNLRAVSRTNFILVH